jgi:hypothetical protein
MDMSWESFYEQASSSRQLYAIKTHRPPRDNQKAIYVVRDGRQALLSYGKFHQTFFGEKQLSLLQLILGMDYYGGWSQHYKKWTEHRPDTLFVRYEDLVSGDESTLTSIERHIQFRGQFRAWSNPFHQLRTNNPSFFRDGKVSWEKDSSWNEFLNGVFFHLHGRTMVELGYVNEADLLNVRLSTSEGVLDLMATTGDLINMNKRLQTTCDERLRIIEELKSACDERLALINQLSGSTRAK